MVSLWNKFKQQFPNADLSRFSSKGRFDDDNILILLTIDERIVLLLIVINEIHQVIQKK